MRVPEATFTAKNTFPVFGTEEMPKKKKKKVIWTERESERETKWRNFTSSGRTKTRESNQSANVASRPNFRPQRKKWVGK